MQGFMNKYQAQYKKEKKKVNFKDRDTILSIIMCVFAVLTPLLGFIPLFSIDGESFNGFQYAFGYQVDGHWDLTFNMFGFCLIFLPLIYGAFMCLKVFRAKTLKNPGVFSIISFILMASCGFFATTLSFVGLNTVAFKDAFEAGLVHLQAGAFIVSFFVLTIAIINVVRIFIKRHELKKYSN